LSSKTEVEQNLRAYFAAVVAARAQAPGLSFKFHNFIDEKRD